MCHSFSQVLHISFVVFPLEIGIQHILLSLNRAVLVLLLIDVSDFHVQFRFRGVRFQFPSVRSLFRGVSFRSYVLEVPAALSLAAFVNYLIVSIFFIRRAC